ncbi:MAG: hypothetical protein BZ138_04905 [Methanosphaera sp. rholeuAM270]|nr:MAG: hypothetical protein BZ138_04905 [Methanosphaera sp. rholeuAM270]
MQINDIEKDSLFGVIGVCGVNGNLIARILEDHNFKVQATDMVSKKDCRFGSSLNDYSMDIYYGEMPDNFIQTSDYIVMPTQLIESKSKLFQEVQKRGVPILSVEDILDLFEPARPVVCICGTNGKTTTTTLLKHLAYSAGLKPCEHNLENMQGNLADIPPLQSRLKGDLSILETGTFGYPGSLNKLLTACKADVALITNITEDHLDNSTDFLGYVNVKGEIVESLRDKTLVVNNDDPTVMALLKKLDYQGNLITFGIETESFRQSEKQCPCGRNVIVDEFIAGVGKYECGCGLKYSKPDYLATEINDAHNRFTLKNDDEEHEFTLKINGLHNIYNAVGAIVLAKEVLNISLDDINKYLLDFEGVDGRMNRIGKIGSKQVMIDYAHNPAGMTTVLKELKNSYDVIVNVITTSSESGIEGDNEILKCSADYSDYIVPASYNAFVCAKKALSEGLYADKIVLPEHMPDEKKHGTLGATVEQVLSGFLKSFELDSDLIVCTGEAAFKYKNILIERLNEIM